MEINYMIAFVTCSCGYESQVLNEDGTDWNESETSRLHLEHWATCENNPEKVGE